MLPTPPPQCPNRRKTEGNAATAAAAAAAAAVAAAMVVWRVEIRVKNERVVPVPILP